MYIPAVYAINKVDQITVEELNLLDKMKHYVPVSAHKEWNLDGLLETRVGLPGHGPRVHQAARGAPDYDDPIILSRKHCTVEDFCNPAAQRHHQELQDGARLGRRASTGRSAWGSTSSKTRTSCR